MKKTLIFAWFFIILGGIISIYFIVNTALDGFWIWGDAKTNFTITGQFGEFIGGVTGTFFALAGTLMIFLTFKEQSKQYKREGFESTFFEMIRLHRENINELRYTKHNGVDFYTAENRKVFRIIFMEFLECFREVKIFSNSKNVDDYLLPKYKNKLNIIIKNNNNKINIIELAIIDIAYNIIFFGVGPEGEIILRDKFKRKYNHLYFYGMLKYIKLKPRRENGDRWEKWQTLLALNYKEFKQVNLELYNFRKHLNASDLSKEAQSLVFEDEFEKYYNGHQHRLGHYFRHLFQSYKYLNQQNDLTDEDKYFFGKTLRAQLSTYEQAILFFNSLSTLGMKWEYTPEQNTDNKDQPDKYKLITRYNLIKNLPGYHLLGIKYETYYPKVKFEVE